MNFFTSLFLGFIEGVTEFLPISSTGHMILVSHALGLENSEFLKLFEVVIQTGAIFAVIFIYLKDLMKDHKYFLKLSIAFLPTGILGVLFHKIIKEHLFVPWVVCLALFIGGIVLILLESLISKIKPKEQTYFHLFCLGIFQCLAFVPGVSRSAATILGGIVLGATREEAVKFSFLLAIPTILAASGYSLLKVNYVLNSNEIYYLIVGLISSFIFGFLSVKIFLKWLNHKTFLICGIYRIVLAIIYYLAFV